MQGDAQLCFFSVPEQISWEAPLPLRPQAPMSSQRKEPFAFGGGEPSQQAPHPTMLLRVKEFA